MLMVVLIELPGRNSSCIIYSTAVADCTLATLSVTKLEIISGDICNV